MPSIDYAPAVVGSAELFTALREEIAAAMKTEVETLDGPQTRTLQERGLQSLGALRIQYRLHERLAVLVPLSELLGARALHDLVHRRDSWSAALDMANAECA
jgi:hypothetical protein